MSIYFGVKISSETNTEKKDSYKFKRNVSIVITIIFFIFLSAIGYNMYRNTQKSIANRLLDVSTKEKNEYYMAKADALCDKMFSKATDREIYRQYKEMKANRPVSESRNLCNNYAKQITGRYT
jgi:hypothetical protein